MTSLDEIKSLIERFLKNEIPANQFDKKYMDLLVECEKPFNHGIDEVLDRLFFKAEVFTDLPMEPTDNPNDYIDENELRESAEKTLKELRALK